MIFYDRHNNLLAVGDYVILININGLGKILSFQEYAAVNAAFVTYLWNGKMIKGLVDIQEVRLATENEIIMKMLED